MLTGKKLVDTLTAELGEIGMGNMPRNSMPCTAHRSFWSLTL